MKPLRLEMQAFLTYKEKEIIDFTLLGDKGIYLISGKTGTGKTAIFDAIMYALYGIGSGKDRTDDQVRSSFATEDEDTYVKLQFEANGKIYEITRNPEYRGPGKRGYKKIERNAVLTSNDGTPPIEGKTEPTKQIEKILGLDAEQFRNIVMISQGEFAKFLKADTSSKEKIFRNLFSTQKFEKLQLIVKEDANSAARDKKDNTIKLQGKVESIVCDEDSDMITFKSNSEFNPVVIKLLERQNTEDHDNLNNLSAIKEKESKKLDALKEDLRNASSIEEEKKQLKQDQTNLDTLKSNKQTILNQQKALSLKEGEINNHQKVVNIIDSQLNLYQQLDEDIQSMNTIQKEINGHQKVIDKYQTSKTQKETRKKEVEKVLETLVNIEVLEEQNKHDIQKESDKQKELNKVKTSYGDYKLQLSELKTLSGEVESLNKNAKEKELDYRNAEIAYNAEKAGILARELQKNEEEQGIVLACPVCGSLEHPKYAELSEGAPSDKDVKRLKEAYEKAVNSFNKKSNEYSGLKGKVEEKEEALKLQSSHLFNSDDISILNDMIQNKQSSIASSLKTLEKAKKEILDKKANKKQLEEELQQLEEAVGSLNQKIHDEEKHHESNQVLILEKKQNVEKLQKQLTYASKTEALNTKKAFEKEIKTYNEEKESVDKNLNEVNEKISGLEGQIKVRNDKIISSKPYDLNTLNQSITEYGLRIKQYDKQYTSIKSRYDHNVGVCKDLVKLNKDQEKIINRLTWLNELHQAFNATKATETGKMTLETYIQTYYFDRVIEKANKRLLAMTDDQYELIRRTEKKSDSKAYALDLRVNDRYTNSLRDASILSGGESFKASLALALGLSDMIQEHAMANKLECMFIDEGFGSLDNDGSLQSAIRELAKLSEGNRLIGIISHVDTLKEMFSENMISVSKTSQGYSRTNVISNKYN